MILLASSNFTKIFFVLIYLGVIVIGAESNQNQYCCSGSGIEYQCQAGTTCCSCSECCTGSEFCIPSIGICVQYVLAVISPITLLLFLFACFWNYKTKRQLLIDLKSLKKLEDEGNEIVKNENNSQKSKLNENSEEGTTQRYIVNSSNTGEIDKTNQLEINLLDYDQSNVIQITQ
ncbi:hypothetical protein ABPG72_014447 [Tetrahymena utriculariae]